MLVEVTDVETGNFRPSIIATGTVIPSQDITLSPRMSGQVIERSSNFTQLCGGRRNTAAN